MSFKSLEACAVNELERVAALLQSVDDFLAVEQQEEKHAEEFDYDDNWTSLPSFSSIDASVVLEYGPRFKPSYRCWYLDSDLGASNSVLEISSFLHGFENPFTALQEEDVHEDNCINGDQAPRSNDITEDAESVPTIQGADEDTFIQSEKTGDKVQNENCPIDVSPVDDLDEYDFYNENEVDLFNGDNGLDEEDPSENYRAGSVHDAQRYYSDQECEAGPHMDESDLDEVDSIEKDVVGPVLSTHDNCGETYQGGAGLTMLRDSLDEQELDEEDKAGLSSHHFNDMKEDEIYAPYWSNDMKLARRAFALAGPALSSCQTCELPDNESMLACENETAHESDTWYHYNCVGLSPETIPSGVWYCPQCSQPQKEIKSDPARTHEEISTKPKHQQIPLKETSHQPTTLAKLKSARQGWKDQDATERHLVEILREYQADETVAFKVRFSDGKWNDISDRLKQRYGITLLPGAMKNQYNRNLRAKYGYDERTEKKRDPNRMQTAVESPESRKKKRKARAEESDQPNPSPSKRAKRDCKSFRRINFQ